MQGASLARFVTLAALIVSVALSLWLADADAIWIILGVAAAWLIASIAEWVAWNRTDQDWGVYEREWRLRSGYDQPNVAGRMVEQTLEWARAQADVIVQRARLGAEQLLSAAGHGDPAIAEAVEAIVRAAEESVGTRRSPRADEPAPPAAPEAVAETEPEPEPEPEAAAPETPDPAEAEPPAEDGDGGAPS